jgi:hypothetical protein
MDMETAVKQDYEQTLIEIMRGLPPGRVEQLVDFPRFLEAQLLSEALLQEEDPDEVEGDNAWWDALLATEKSQAWLEKMAEKARAEHRAGKSRPMVFDDEGRLVPE